MIGPRAQRLADGRLHLWHGPIDLVIGAEGPGRAAALRAAQDRFQTILTDLVAELPLLRSEVSRTRPLGVVARRMHGAVWPHRSVFVTPMAAVAGAVADEVMAAMRAAGPLDRGHVNNGGDIALHLAPGRHYRAAVSALDGREVARLAVRAKDGIGGIATSGQGGRSFSLGIAEQVTVLAATAAGADAAATLIANAVDLPGHKAIHRRPACDLAPDSDLGARLVVTGCGQLDGAEVARALDAGRSVARDMLVAGLIRAAALMLRGKVRLVGAPLMSLTGEVAEDA